MTELSHIERLAENFSADHAMLSAAVSACESAMNEIRAQHLPTIKRCVQLAARSRQRLADLVAANPQLFTKPKSQTFAGVKLGYRKGSGKMEWDDPDKVLERIKKLYPGDASKAYINTKESPDKKALEDLDAKTLGKLGITLEDTADIVFIKVTDSEVEKTIKALLGKLETDTEPAE